LIAPTKSMTGPTAIAQSAARGCVPNAPENGHAIAIKRRFSGSVQNLHLDVMPVSHTSL
jgi:hypothetical protein